MRTRSRLLPLSILPLLLAGCLGTAPAAPPTADDAPPLPVDAPVMMRRSCSGFNGFSHVDAAALRPYVPANWTFTGPRSVDLAILRLHVAGCDAAAATDDDPYDFHLILSTPMQPDEASQAHHDNPDVILAVYTDNETEVANWTRAGVPAFLATFDWAEDTTGDVVAVRTDTGTVLDFYGVNPHQRIPTTEYRWPAAYASGTTDIAWVWGHENATSRAAAFRQQDYGPASPFPGLLTQPYSLSVWMGFDVTYAAGTPPTE